MLFSVTLMTKLRNREIVCRQGHTASKWKNCELIRLCPEPMLLSYVYAILN